MFHVEHEKNYVFGFNFKSFMSVPRGTDVFLKLKFRFFYISNIRIVPRGTDEIGFEIFWM